MQNLIREYVEEEDQWFEHGWRLKNDVICSYTRDRKEQNMQTGREFTIKEFLEDPDIDVKIKRWLKDVLGDSCDILIEEDIMYKN